MIRPASLRDEITLVTLSPTGTPNETGDETYEEDTSTIAAAVTPVDTDEIIVGRETRLNRYFALVRPEVEVSGIDAVIYEGRRLELVGEPEILKQRGVRHHLRLELQEIEG